MSKQRGAGLPCGVIGEHVGRLRIAIDLSLRGLQERGRRRVPVRAVSGCTADDLEPAVDDELLDRGAATRPRHVEALVTSTKGRALISTNRASPSTSDQEPVGRTTGLTGIPRRPSARSAAA